MGTLSTEDKVRKGIGRREQLKGDGLRRILFVFYQRKDMKEAVTKEDKLNVEWIGMQIMLELKR